MISNNKILFFILFFLIKYNGLGYDFVVGNSAGIVRFRNHAFKSTIFCLERSNNGL